MGLVLPSIGGEPGGPMWPPLRRDYKPSGTGGSGTRPYGGNEPGALVRQSQALLWNRSSCNFCKPRPQWAGRNRGQPLHFCAPEIQYRAKGITPVMGSGESGPMDLGGAVVHRPRPRWRFGSFAAMGKGTRRPQAAKSSLRNMKLLQNLPPHPSGLRPATFPPGGRLLEGEHLSSAGGRLKRSRLQNPRDQK